MVEVRLSAGGIGWVVHVPEILADSPEAETVYQHMADTVLRERERHQAIVQANKGV